MFDVFKKLYSKVSLKWRILIPVIAFAGGGAMIVIIIVIVMSPVINAMNAIDEAVKETSGFFEKMGNFFSFNGFVTDEDAFKEKIRVANSTYGERIDLPLALATIYYPFDTSYNKQAAGCLDNVGEETEAGCEDYTSPADLEDTSGEAAESETEIDPATFSVKLNILQKLIDNMLSTTSGTPDYERYDAYLKTNYVNTALFGYPWGYDPTTEADKISSKIDKIIADIHGRADLYNDLFLDKGAALQGDIEISNLMSGGFIAPPLKGEFTITSCFGWRVLDGMTHKGIDTALSDDKNIYAVGDGTVSEVNYSASMGNCATLEECTTNHIAPGGNFIQIDHLFNGVKYSTLYKHLSSIGADITVGKIVKKGDIIGVVGNTGHSTGPHLHFEFRYDTDGDGASNPVNAIQLFSAATSLTGDNCPESIAGNGVGGNYSLIPGAVAQNIVTVANAMATGEHSVYNNSTLCYIGPSKTGATAIRVNTYNGIKTGAHFLTDCNGFVGLVLKEALGLTNVGTSKSDVTFFGPSGGQWVPRSHNNYFTKLTTNGAISPTEVDSLIANGGVQPGDIFGFNGGSSTHIIIYVGDGMVVENKGGSCGSVIKKQSFTRTNHYDDGSRITIFRAK
ncbi:MAG: M23 family metallopeptidase [Bacilli bacterium]|nr:M23 family metallopeptidase [Bacilli bacterium]